MVTAFDVLEQKYDRLLAAVVEHHAQRADDRCFLDDDKLYSAAGLPPVDRRVGDKAVMLENCKRFIKNRCEEGGPWKSYVALEAENAARSLVAAMKAIDDAIVAGHDPGEEIQLFAGLEWNRQEALKALRKAEYSLCATNE